MVGWALILSFLGNRYSWKDSNQNALNDVKVQNPKFLNFKEQNQNDPKLKDAICNLVL